MIMKLQTNKPEFCGPCTEELLVHEKLMNTLDLLNPIGSPQPLDLLKSSMLLSKSPVCGLWAGCMTVSVSCRRRQAEIELALIFKGLYR